MDIIVIILALEASLAASVVLAVVVHEFGHAGAAALFGVAVRSVNIGVGRPILRRRVGQTWIVLRAFPFTGWVYSLLQLDEPRWRRAAVVLGGPCSNLFVLLILFAAYADSLLSFMAFLFLAFGQAMLLLSMVPMKTSKGPARVSDGLQLWRLARRADWNVSIATHRTLLGIVLPPDAPIPPSSHATSEILYQFSRPDRLTDDWAMRDAVADMKALLQDHRAEGAERALVLYYLAETALLRDTGANSAEIDAWSSEALSLGDTQALRITRAGARATLGHGDEAEAALLKEIDGPAKAETVALAQIYLGIAAMARGDGQAAARRFQNARTFATDKKRKILLKIIDDVELRHDVARLAVER